MDLRECQTQTIHLLNTAVCKEFQVANLGLKIKSRQICLIGNFPSQGSGCKWITHHLLCSRNDDRTPRLGIQSFLMDTLCNLSLDSGFPHYSGHLGRIIFCCRGGLACTLWNRYHHFCPPLLMDASPVRTSEVSPDFAKSSLGQQCPLLKHCDIKM